MGRLDLHLVLAAMLLVVMFGLALGVALHQSPTFDEGFYIARGWAFWKTGQLMPLGHPPLSNLLSGLGVLLEPGLPDPVALDGWATNDADRFSRDLLWQHGLDIERVTLLARLPIIWLGLLLGALLWRWAREDYGLWSAALALILFVFTPDVLAHTSLATTDLSVAAFYVGTVYAWSRFLRRPRLGWLVISGVVFGLAQGSKFSALLLAPTLLIITVWYAAQRGAIVPKGYLSRLLESMGGWPLGTILTGIVSLGLMGLVGLITLCGAYLFTLRPYPLSGYMSELQHFLSLASGGHNAYLLGRLSPDGWWYYHPFVFLVKTPLAVLILLLLAIGLALGYHVRRRDWLVVGPALLYFGATILGSLNVGSRYLLPALPLLLLFTSRVASGPIRSGWLKPLVLVPLVGWTVIISSASYPDYLAFFNIAAGGSGNGYRVLVDSNLDWGQSLPALARYLRERGAGRIYLSYFGQAEPAYYGIDYVALPSWPPPPPDPGRPPFHPIRPEAGLYAISASNLVGVQLHDPNSFGYFLGKQPVAKVGYSIFVYEVPPSGEDTPGWFAQCANPDPYESDAAIERLTGLSDLANVYFDCTQSLAFPEGHGWLLLPADVPPLVDLGLADYVSRNETGVPEYYVWLVAAPPPVPRSVVEFPAVVLPLPIAGHLELMGYEIDPLMVEAGGTVTLTAWWRFREPPPPPVSIFAHLVAPDGVLVVAGDALGLFPEFFATGTVLVQQHRFNVEEGTPPGDYTLEVGLYSLDTGRRYPVSQSGERVIDRIVLRTVRVETTPTR